MFNILQSYRKLERHIIDMIAVTFCLQFINSIFFLALNIYMTKCGYQDYEIANFVSYRFFAIVLFAVPFGLFIKGKRLRPIYIFTSVSLPILSLLIIECVEQHINWLLQMALVLWGISFSSIFIITLPYILRNADEKTHTEAFSLNAASWSANLIVVGFGVYVLSHLTPDYFQAKQQLQLFSCCGFLSIFFALKMKKEEYFIKKTNDNQKDFHQYDWQLIFIAAFPVFMIALGAGLIIPFMDLFFYHVFDMDIDKFSLLGSTTSILVAVVALLVPKIKAKFGYEAITSSQLAAVVMLFLLGATDFISHHWFAVYLAIFCYVMRQPLMNLANPLTSEMTMYYVGKKNQEIMSAIMSSIWSGSWFFSSQIFRLLREHLDLRYGYICYITASLYLLGVLLYFFLIKDFRRKQKAECH